MPLQTVRNKRLVYFDTARGLAAISVITWHFLLAVYSQNPEHFIYKNPLHFFWYGEANVIFFFIHSGFILTYSYIGTKIFGVIDYFKFLIERAFRIYPLFILILLISHISAAYIKKVSLSGWVSNFWGSEHSIRDLLHQAILFVRIPSSPTERLIPQDWTLTVELVVCAVLPLLALTYRKQILAFLLILIAGIELNLLNTYTFEFGIGIVLFFNREKITHVWKRIPKTGRVFVFLTAVTFYTGFFVFPSLFSSEIRLFHPAIDRLLVDSGCALFFCILIGSFSIQKILSYPLLVKIGKTCYSIYLIHALLLFVTWRYFGGYLSNLKNRELFAVVGCYLIYLTAVLILASLTYLVIEKPLNLFGKYLSRQFGNLLTGAKETHQKLVRVDKKTTDYK